MILAGLTAGAIAAVIAALVSLPLHSPVDIAFNSATVTVAALVVGVLSGFLWTRFAGRMLWFLGGLAGIFLVALIVALAGSVLLERLVSFMVPLAAIIVVICAALTPPLAAYFERSSRLEKGTSGLQKWLPAIAVIVALAVGIPLMWQGDAESGELALPPPPTAAPATAAPPTAAPTAALANTPAPTAIPSTVASATAARPTAAARTTVTATPVPAKPTPEPSPTSAVESSETEDGAQSFIIGEGSEITFTVEEELGRSPIRFDAVISSTGLSGAANLDGQPSVVTLDLHSLTSDQQFRDRYIQSRMFPDTPEAIVTVDQLPDLPQSFFDGETTTGQLEGSLQIGDTATPLVFDVTARKDGNTINILGLTTFTWEQLGLAKPTARSVVYLADEVRVQVLLIASAP